MRRGGATVIIIADYAGGVMQTCARSLSGNSKLVQQQRFAGVYVTMAQQLGKQAEPSPVETSATANLLENTDAELSGRHPTRATHQRTSSVDELSNLRLLGL